MVLDFRILGELSIFIDGRPVQPPGGRVAQALGVLLLTPGEPVSDERLLELTWGPGGGTQRALQCAVSRLRSWLCTHGLMSSLTRSGAAYQLHVDAECVDIGRFWARVRSSKASSDPSSRIGVLSSALHEWRGPVLGGRNDWLIADPVSRRAEQTRIDCACELADLALSLDRPAQVLPTMFDVAAQAPYDEPLHARLVRLLHACGRRAAAVQEVERVRARLAEDLGIDPSAELQAVNTLAWREAAATVNPPSQLPPDIPDFTGRPEEGRRICDWLTPDIPSRSSGAVRIVVITGMPGTGKSVLAVHSAHKLAPIFPDGQLYADLCGGTTTPAALADILTCFLHATGVRDIPLHASTAECAGLFRTSVKGRSILVVLDNAASAGQVRPLMPGTSACAVLVTSRTDLAGISGSRLVNLDVLTLDRAIALLKTVADRSGITLPIATDIVINCDLLPLAVRIAGLRLATQPWLRPEQLASALRDEHRRLDVLTVGELAVRATLESSYRCLDEDGRRLFRALGLLNTREVMVASAAAALNTTHRSASTQLEMLAEARLLDRLGADITGQMRYGLRNLVRLYAQERAVRMRTRRAGSGVSPDSRAGPIERG